jgi:hypothetical protein
MRSLRIALTLVVFFALIGVSFGATPEDVLKKDLEILVDQYASATIGNDTSAFAAHFSSYMIGTNRLGKAAEQERTHHQRLNEITLNDVVYSAPIGYAKFEVKKQGQIIAKGEITTTYSLGESQMKLIMVKFSDQVVKYNDVEKLAKEQKTPTEKKENKIYLQDQAPDFGQFQNKDLEI